MFVLKIQESAENYLETIYMLSRHKPYVRSIDIANELSFSKPSVSVAMNRVTSHLLRLDSPLLTLCTNAIFFCPTG